MSCTRPDLQARLEGLLLRDARPIEPRRWRALRDHLHACGVCHQRYDRMMAVRRTLQSDSAPLSGEQLGLVGDLVLEAVAPRRRPWISTLSLIAAGVAAVALFSLVMPLPRSAPEEYQARGLVADGSTGVGVRALCVSVDAPGSPSVRAVFPERGDAPVHACHLGDLLTFTYTNSAPGREPYNYLFIVGVDETGAPLWYYPQPAEQRSVVIERDGNAVDQALPGAVRLSVNHHAGLVRVLAFFTKQPLPLQSVEQRLGELGPAAQNAAATLTVGETPAELVSFLVRIEP